MNQGQRRQLTPEERAIRQRRLKRKRNIRLALVITGFFLILSLIISPIIIFAAFRIKTFSVEGTAPYTKDEVIAASGLIQGKNLLFANLDEATEAIEKNLPYTDNVKITKKLPSGIIIRLDSTEKAFAVKLSNGTFAMVDGNMKVLEYSPEITEDIALIQGAVPTKSEIGEILSFEETTVKENGENIVEDRKLPLILEITTAMEENGITDIDLIDIGSVSNIYLIYQNRIVINLGDSSSIPSKLSLGQRVINEENAISLSQAGTINLTVEKKAYFNPSDPEDIKELVLFNGGEWEDDEEEGVESENSEEEETSAEEE